MCRVISFTNSRKISFLATKSVSQLTSTNTPTFPCRWMYEATIPSFAERDAFFEALAIPFFRNRSSAFSRSPSVSTSAFLQSIMPALAFSRSCLTSAGFTSAIDQKKDVSGLMSQKREFEFTHPLHLARPRSIFSFLAHPFHYRRHPL